MNILYNLLKTFNYKKNKNVENMYEKLTNILFVVYMCVINKEKCVLVVLC